MKEESMLNKDDPRLEELRKLRTSPELTEYALEIAPGHERDVEIEPDDPRPAELRQLRDSPEFEQVYTDRLKAWESARGNPELQDYAEIERESVDEIDPSRKPETEAELAEMLDKTRAAIEHEANLDPTDPRLAELASLRETTQFKEQLELRRTAFEAIKDVPGRGHEALAARDHMDEIDPENLITGRGDLAYMLENTRRAVELARQRDPQATKQSEQAAETTLEQTNATGEREPRLLTAEQEQGPKDPFPEALRKTAYIKQEPWRTLVYADAKGERELFRQEGDRLRTKDPNEQNIKAMLDTAQHRGWQTVTVRGANEFKREAWLEASARGLKVQGYKPSELDQEELKRREEKYLSNEIAPAAEQTGPAKDLNRALLEAHLTRRIEQRFADKPEEIERTTAVMKEMLDDIEQRTGRLPQLSVVDDKDLQRSSPQAAAAKLVEPSKTREHNKDRDVGR